MKFNTDHYFHIGATHYTSGKPCQDYALSGSNETLACAIVSDGCSTGRHTDVGSRILTLSTLQAIRDHAKAFGGKLDTAIVSITSRQQQIISTSRSLLGLDPADMLATCAYVYVTEQGAFVHLQGDGVVAIKYKSDIIHMDKYEWVNNTPFYPSYGEGGLEAFVGIHGGDLDSNRLFVQSSIRMNEAYTELPEQGITLREGLDGIIVNISREMLEDIEFIAVFSDGVAQIDEVDWKDAVSDFLSFKNWNGDFAKRRMIRGIKEMQKKGKGPIDDISYAVVRIDNSKEEGEIPSA